MIGHSPYLLLLVLLPGLGSLLAHVVQGWSAASVRDKARMAGRFEMLGLGAALLLGVLVVRGYVSWNATLDAPGYLVQPLWSFLSGGRLAAALGLALDPAGALMALAVLFAAFIAVLVRRPEQYGSVEGSGATAGALLLVILADGPVTAGMGWGALLASRALRTSRTHLVPLAGLAVLIGSWPEPTRPRSRGTAWGPGPWTWVWGSSRPQGPRGSSRPRSCCSCFRPWGSGPSRRSRPTAAAQGTARSRSWPWARARPP